MDQSPQKVLFDIIQEAIDPIVHREGDVSKISALPTQDYFWLCITVIWLFGEASMHTPTHAPVSFGRICSSVLSGLF